MATTRCWALHGNVQNAIDYIINDEKTDHSLLVESKNCSPQTAGYLWKQQRLLSEEEIKKNSIVGYHFQMSFKAHTVTPEEVMELSKEWIEKVTGGNHDYVISVHVDHQFRKINPHIHSHIIVNPQNTMTGNKLQIYYKKDLPVFKSMADHICKERGLEILENPGGSGKSYYEWMLKNQGDSLKSIVKKTIDEVIPKVKNYGEFRKYLTRLGYSIQDGLDKEGNATFQFRANVSLINGKLTDDKYYFIKIPSTDDYVRIEKNKGNWINDDQTFVVNVKENEELIRYDECGMVKSLIVAQDLKNNFTCKSVGKSGLRIKVPNSEKFIRCNNIDKNEAGEGYSLTDIIKRIKNNDCFYSDPQVLDFINSPASSNNQELKDFYQAAGISVKWENSDYYVKSKRERFIEFKTNEIQQRLSDIHKRRMDANDILILGRLKEDREELQNELKSISSKLKQNELELSSIQIERLEQQIEMSDHDIEKYVDENIVPLRNLKRTLKEEISKLSFRINKAEHKKDKNKEKVI